MSAPSRLPTVGDLVVVAHRIFTDQRGSLVPVELSSAVPFPVVRAFWVFDVPTGSIRGGHAHRHCSQYVMCLRGAAVIFVDDGEDVAEFRLEAGSGLLIPPMIWASERYLTAETILMVLCDRSYEVEDYIDDKDEVRAERRLHAPGA